MLIPTTILTNPSGVATPPFLGTPSDGGSAVAIGNTDVYLVKVWVPIIFTVNSMALRVSVSSGNLLFGIYSSGGTRLYTSGSVASPGTGARAHTTSSPVALSAGWVYSALQASDGTFAPFFLSSGIGVAFSFANTFGSDLPSSLPALSNLATPIPLTLHP